MNNNQPITRRGFLKTAVATGGAMALTSLLPAGATQRLFPKDKIGNDISPDELLQGVCDIHLHAAPDSRERSVNEWDFTFDAKRVGYRAIMFKSNDFSCHDRAFLIRQGVSGIEVFGSLCMNRVHGDKVNAHAAKKAVETSGGTCRCIWMPTQDANYPFRCEGQKEKGIPVLDNSGRVLPEVVKVMEICAENNIIFATGHSSPEESIVLARKAHEVGVERFVVTHTNSHLWIMTPEQIDRCVNLGAYIEFCYLPCLWGADTQMNQFSRQSIKDFTAFLRIAPERSFITTDLGQLVMPHPIEGMRHCIIELMKNGFSKQEIDQLVRTIPAYLVGLTNNK